VDFVSLSKTGYNKRYYNKEDANTAINVLNNTMLDMRIIRVDLDTGFEEGRQYGRGYSGAQKRDEVNSKQDPDRPNLYNKSLYF
jgi:nuclear cap-binding protein subunit 2